MNNTAFIIAICTIPFSVMVLDWLISGNWWTVPFLHRVGWFMVFLVISSALILVNIFTHTVGKNMESLILLVAAILTAWLRKKEYRRRA